MVGMALVTASVTCGAPSQKSTYAAKADDSSITSNGNRFFRSGTAVLQGRIEGKLPDGIIYYGYDGVTGESKPKAYSVNADGTFTIVLTYEPDDGYVALKDGAVLVCNADFTKLTGETYVSGAAESIVFEPYDPYGY